VRPEAFDGRSREKISAGAECQKVFDEAAAGDAASVVPLEELVGVDPASGGGSHQVQVHVAQHGRQQLPKFTPTLLLGQLSNPAFEPKITNIYYFQQNKINT